VADAVHIRTKAPDITWVGKAACRDGAAVVSYTVYVPRNAIVEKVEVVNGAIEAAGLAGFVRLDNVNGNISVDRVTGDVKAVTVNGSIQAMFQRATRYAFASLQSTNGSIAVSLPADANMEVSAETSNGALLNDFGFPVYGAVHSSQGFFGTLVSRTALLTLQTVNGSIRVRRLR
jgi:DUF4097 and DUF4098 domain-containing protein YvlB